MHDRVFHYETINSTQDVAKSHLASGDIAPFWVTADRQTHGRGRRGRDWLSTEGNFLGSYVTKAPADVSLCGHAAFAAALAVYETLNALNAGNLALKWPNDVLLDGGKVSGILIEITGDNLVIGIGVNLENAPVLPSSHDIPAKSLEHLASRDVFFKKLDMWLDKYLAKLMPQTLAALRSDFESRMNNTQKIWADDGKSRIRAHIRGIDTDGALIAVDDYGVERRYLAADIIPERAE